MNLLLFLIRKSKEMKVTTEMVNKAEIDDELSRFYDQLLTELNDSENIDIYTVDADNDDEHPQLMMLIRS